MYAGAGTLIPSVKPLLRTLCPETASVLRFLLPNLLFPTLPKRHPAVYQEREETRENKGHFNPYSKALIPSWFSVFSLGTVLKQKV